MEHLDELLINMVLLTLMAVVVFGVIFTKNLYAVVVLSGIYSFLMAGVMIVLDAVDVALTEASVGAGISTVLMFVTLYLTKEKEAPFSPSLLIPTFVVVVTAGALIWGSIDLPDFGSATAPEHVHVAPHYLSQGIPETTVPNIVTAVLASYRGYDTMGEVAVVFVAGIAIMLLLKGRPPSRARSKDADPSQQEQDT